MLLDEVDRALEKRGHRFVRYADDCKVYVRSRLAGGRSLPEVVERLQTYMPGWKGYFQLVQAPQVSRELDKWPRHRLRALQLKHWRRGTAMYRELLALGASRPDAQRIAANSRRWWRNSCFALNRVMPIAYFDRLGVPRVS